MSKEIELKVREMLRKAVGLGSKVDNFGVQEDLGNLGMNSLTFIKLIVAIESEYDFEVEDEELDFDNFKTLEDIVSYIEKKL